jgi:hypothetical protein
MAISLVAAVLLVAGSAVTAGGFVTGVPPGVTAALVLINLVVALAVGLVSLAVYDLIRRRGALLQRPVLAVTVPVAVAALPLLAYWNLLGFRF